LQRRFIVMTGNYMNLLAFMNRAEILSARKICRAIAKILAEQAPADETVGKPPSRGCERGPLVR